MHLLQDGKAFAKRPSFALAKLLLIMRLTALMLLAASLHVSARSYSQTVTIASKRMTLEGVFREIEAQTGYSVLWNENLFDKTYHVQLDVKDAPLASVLDLCLRGLPLSYKIENRVVLIEAAALPTIITVTGVVTESGTGRPLAGATVKIKGTQIGVTADANGRFSLPGVDPEAVLVVSFVGYQETEIPLRNRKTLVVALREKPTALNETLIIGYGTTSRERSTGSISTISAETIHDQPVSNPLSALEGRVTGLNVVTTSGRPGANIQVQLRGTNSIGAGTDPLYIIDGVPYNSTPLNQFDYLGDPPVGDQSPLNSINPNDIESISVLKDADATAIYGSRGANGVILITTKRARNTNGKVVASADVYEGWGRMAHYMDLLNTPQYLKLRKQAYTNDGLNYLDPTQSPADLTVFSQTQNTNWQKLLLGNTAHTTNASVRLETGADLSRFSLGLTYRKESTIYPGSNADQRMSANMNYDFTSFDRKFGLQMTNSFSYDKNDMMSGDPATSILSVPNQAPYTATGALNWNGLGNLTNPLAVMYQPFNNTTSNLISNAVVHYQVLPTLDLKVSAGYNQAVMNQVNTFPSTSAAPSAYYQPFAQFGRTSLGSWVVEPQLNYFLNISKGRLSFLAGSTLQRRVTDGDYIYAYGYSSDLLLNSPAAAGSTYMSYNNADYRYASVFGRLNYDWLGKYIISFNARRDGSSRFGPDKRYGNFGSVGAAWVFSKEGFMKGAQKWLNFGKVRASYGTTGNDQIGDYGYSSNYSTPYARSFQGITALVPGNLSNSQYSWESDKKLNIGLDLGFADSRILVTADYYRNRTGNQLVGYALPAITGFTTVQYNLPAVIQNKGLELDITSVNIRIKNFTWKTTLNLTVPKNQLLKFPNLAGSSYAYSYAIGQSVNVAKGYQLLRIDSTGNPVYLQDHSGADERVVLGNTDPKFYGGIQNSFTYKSWNLRFFVQLDKKDGYNYLSSTFYPMGSENNFDALALQAWTTPGQNTAVPKATTSNYNWYYYTSSSAAFGDASYLRLKTVYLSYELPRAALAKIGATRASVYVQGYNLFTITGYRGLDPETGGVFTPVVRTLTGGIQLSF
ncbi:SusC/RagA family TonB-linked outer membrane protein [Dinghuibacter silviterrae]|uniref:TonB-linked SusC/RagA family outer membrane protein n=1 Tax=Dinghuibacter silviterrae TaxID=1539049 RepID=A0A4R8DT16_9BACT|nr:SusC/RagA family TonB-linked outer membrane protein [Dinghuibacter silviterrae]TDX01424.1 TonB-linked SusC/RagA family outer membrane protein [Dinghuibacter silviterrae]